MIKTPLTLLLAGLVGGPLAAQVPGDNLFERRTFREEYRAVTYEEVKKFLQSWSQAVTERKVNGLKQLVTEQVYFAPNGWLAANRPDFTDSIKVWLPRVTGFYFSLNDFEASGNMAYLMGSVRYQVSGLPAAPAASGSAGDAGAEGGATGTGSVFNGEAVMVLYREGSQWKIRSYFERSTH